MSDVSALDSQNAKFVLFQYHQKLARLMGKLGCVGGEKRGLGDCPKSQSFYSGVDLVSGSSNTANRTMQQQQDLKHAQQQQQQQQLTALPVVDENGRVRVLNS